MSNIKNQTRKACSLSVPLAGNVSTHMWFPLIQKTVIFHEAFQVEIQMKTLDVR